MMLKEHRSCSKPVCSSFRPQLAEIVPMKQITLSVLMVGILTFVLTLPGCGSGAPIGNLVAKKGTEVILVRQTVRVEPNRVVNEAINTLNQLKLNDINPSQTAVDAVIEFSSARKRQYQLIITGISLNKTRIEILGLKNSVDQEQANLIFEQIENNLYTRK